MRDQYAGDVSDVLKFAFLRALAGTDRTLGVAWYYVPGHDGRTDGRHLEWHGEPAWCALDAKLCDGLSSLPERSIAALERAPIWSRGRLFYREPVPSRTERAAWSLRMQAALDGANIVFLDPDNGLGETKKHATSSEIQLLRTPGRAIVLITFPDRTMSHQNQVQRLHEKLRVKANAERPFTLRTTINVLRTDGSRSYVPRQRWFTVVDPDTDLIARARAFAGRLHYIPVRSQLDGIGMSVTTPIDQ